MAKVIYLVGNYGVGKSYALRNMPPESTLIVNVNKSKDLPFKGSRKKFTILDIVNNKGNFAEPTNAKNIKHLITFPEKLLGNNFAALNITESKILKRFKYAVIDDCGYTMTKEFLDNANVKGFDKFTNMAVNLYDIVKAAELSPLDYVILVLHTEEVYNGSVIVGEKIKTVGRMVDSAVRLEGLPAITLRCSVDFQENGEPYFHFVTNKQENMLARSAYGMLPLKMPNDLYEAIKLADAYYNNEENL